MSTSTILENYVITNEICKYCNKQAKYAFKSGTFCCERTHVKCSAIREKGSESNTKIPLFSQNSQKLTHKKFLINERGHKCEKCNNSDWLGQPITLELEHIDGDNKNQEKDNLLLLCPNCHSQTKTWRGRNINSKKISVSDQELTEALLTTENIRQALMKVGLTPKAENYTRASKLLNLNYDDVIQTNNSQFGTCWVHNYKQNKKIKLKELENYLSLGWIKGRIHMNPPNLKGRFWITNGIQSRLIKPDDIIPTGFWKGKVQR